MNGCQAKTTPGRSVRVMVALLAGMLLAAGCAQPGTHVPGRVTIEDADLVGRNYQAAEALLSRVPWLKDNRQPLLTATFVNINGLETSSALGRMIAEQIASRFSQQGFTMIEMKMRNNVFIKEGAGEFVLSRMVRDLSRNHDAAGVIAGIYAVGKNTVYVNARLIRATDSLILASFDYTLPLGPDTKALLASQ